MNMRGTQISFDIRDGLDVDVEIDSCCDDETEEDFLNREDNGEASNETDQALEEKIDDRSASERTAELLQRMAPHRRALLSILAACDGAETQSLARIQEAVDRVEETKHPVYDALGYCTLLEKAGAIERTEGDVSSAISNEPEVVRKDGAAYLQVKQPVETRWRITQTGKQVLVDNKPTDRLRALLADERVYAPIYKRILSMVSQEGGSTMPAIEGAVDGDPLLENPRYYASRFIDKLERCEAICWSGTWQVTAYGQKGSDIIQELEAAGKEG